MKTTQEYSNLLQTLEATFRKRNLKAASLLRPGLKEAVIRKRLDTLGVRNAIDELCAWYGWRNGGQLSPESTLEELALIPETAFCNTEFALMACDFSDFKEFAKDFAVYAEVSENCFPILWDGSAQYIGIDVRNPGRDRVLLFGPKNVPACVELYRSFAEFLADLVIANETESRPKIFDKLGRSYSN